MRAASRLLANIKSSRFLESGTPTGLTGLVTHPAPRSTLLYLYNTTLDNLKNLPESSVYRQSSESLTRHRLKIVEQVKPEGYEEWLTRTRGDIESRPELFEPTMSGDGERQDPPRAVRRGGETFVAVEVDERDPDSLEWDGEPDLGPVLEGTRSSEEKLKDLKPLLMNPGPVQDEKPLNWVPEPPLDKDQIAEIENKIGAGLIEEVIQVAEGELRLVEIMAQSKPWESLEEKPPENQWTYFDRGNNTGTT